jgi:hypothetical protein
MSLLCSATKRKERDFDRKIQDIQPYQKKYITEDDLENLRDLRLVPVKWNASLYNHIDRYRVPISHLKRTKQITEEESNNIDDIDEIDELVKPLKKLKLTKRKEVLEEKKPAKKETKRTVQNDDIISSSSSNQTTPFKKMTVMEFLQKDDDKFGPFTSFDKQYSRKMNKFQSWLASQMKAELDKNEDTKALIPFRSSYQELQPLIRKFLIHQIYTRYFKQPTHSSSTIPSTVTVEEVMDETQKDSGKPSIDDIMVEEVLN